MICYPFAIHNQKELEMRKKRKNLFHLLTPLLTASSLWAAEPTSCTLTPQEEALLTHLQESISRAEQGDSKLSSEVLHLDGMSSPKVRHLLNNLSSREGTHYLEIGSWKGSTWISSLFGNAHSIASATAIDNWILFNPREIFWENCSRYLEEGLSYRVLEEDCFQVDLSLFSHPINLYFYDGEHRPIDQEEAFTYFNPVLDNLFIAIVDDWNFPGVPEGTRSAFEKLGYTILFERVLPANGNGDLENWWNGLYVALIRKP